ncbi:MAG TPA: thiamine pyrophosphate-binding protein [Candidatus Omnitrophota bacterium]|nr:thiamine pyrophosphate-binding protein [Candidatus Omnitrophota bacterium]HRZ15428.1 thiamine pyrophosphate-binding protein [Candidatus Omnitrophota bacterium]
MDVNEAIVKTLEHIGVDHVFGGSGQVNGSMLLALKKSPQIKTVIIRNEQAASFMACGYSMFSDKLGVCFATGGPGEFNLFSGLAVAYSDSLPVLGISGYTSARDRGKGALNEATGKSRTPDSPAMFNATTKKSMVIEDPDSTCDILEELINLAYEGRPGPVHIHVPKDVTIMQVKNFREIKVDIKKVLPRQQDIDAVADALAKALQNNEPICAVLGYGVVRSHGEREAQTLVEKFQIPFSATMDSKGLIPEDHPLNVGIFGTSGDPGANKYIMGAKVILAIGNSFAQNWSFGFKPDLFKDKILIHINIDRHEIDKVYKADYPVLSDARPAIIALTEALSKRVKTVAPKKVEKDLWFDRPVQAPGTKIHPADLAKAISRNLPANSFVMGDAGAHMLWLNCYMHLTKNQIYQNPGSFGPMASHVNGAIGVKCAHPDKVVVCGCGDGAYQMAGFELMTAIQYNIPVIWVIFDNGEFNVIKKFLLNLFNDQAFMQFTNPDFVKYAEACKAFGARVEKLEDFDAVFQKALACGKAAIIDVVVESEVYPPFGLGKV